MHIASFSSNYTVYRYSGLKQSRRNIVRGFVETRQKEPSWDPFFIFLLQLQNFRSMFTTVLTMLCLQALTTEPLRHFFFLIRLKNPPPSPTVNKQFQWNDDE